MTEIVTPDQIIQALSEIREQANRGIDLLYSAEQELAKLTQVADQIETKAFVRIKGLVADRQALSKLEAAEAREAAELARAKYNHIKLKLQMLNQEQTAVQTQARMVELTYRNS